MKPEFRLGKPARRTVVLVFGVTLLLVLGSWAGWLLVKAALIRDEISATTQLVPELKRQLAAADVDSAHLTVQEVLAHTSAARETADSPLWTLASGLPFIGANFSAISEATRSADDVAALGLVPLVSVGGSLDWDRVLPSAAGSDLAPLKAASPLVSSASYAVRASAERLAAIDQRELIPQVAEPITEAIDQLKQVTATLDIAADAAELAPDMLGANGPRNYLLIIQNNAEARASGGIPGALAVLTLDNGKLTLGEQSSASDLGVMSPVVPTDIEQQQIYSSRLGKFVQDVNLTPDFPTAASTAQAMWEQKTGRRVDGVLSMDPIALSYILAATGPVSLTDPELAALSGSGLPIELSAENVVSTLLSDVYAKVREPAAQDSYFAGVAKQIFSVLSEGRWEPEQLLQGLTRATGEGRILVWSGATDEQSVLGRYRVGGSINGASVQPAEFGVYFNDGTGAKMDYYVKRTVQLIKECPKDGYEQTGLRVTSTNTAPPDAATSLPAYVVGDGHLGVPQGTVQTNIVAYGPTQALVETAKVDGYKTEFAPYFHSGRPVGVLAIRLAPGESRTVDFIFGKIVQHTEPNLVVTPTVQDVKDVTLPTVNAACG